MNNRQKREQSWHMHLFFPLLNIDKSGVVLIHKGPHGCGKLWRREK